MKYSSVNLLCSTMLAAFALQAQSVPDFLSSRGVYAGGAYTFDKQEAINKYNGVLTYTIPITSMPLGRAGMSVSVNLVYSSALQDVTYYNSTGQNQVTTTYPYITSSSSAGWSIGGFSWSLYEQAVSPSASCSTSKPGPYRLFVVTPDGSHHALKLYGQYDYAGESSYWINPESGLNECTNQTLPSPLRYFTSDGTYITVAKNIQTGGFVISLPDGTTVSNMPGQSTIQDRNGNKVSVTTDGSGNTVLTDDLRRTITIPQGFLTGGSITQTGFAGANLSWTVNGTSAHSIPGTCLTVGPRGCGAFTGGGITSLTVPSDSGTLSYSFGYDSSSGELTSVTLPYGAKTTYTYQRSNQNYPALVTAKQVSYIDQSDNGSTPITEQWIYTYANCTYGTCPTSRFYTRVQRPDQGIETTYFHGTLPSDPLYQMPTKVVLPDGSTTEYLYYQNRPLYSQGSDPANPYVALTVHSVASGGTPTYASFESSAVDKNGNITSRAVYDWVPYSSVSHDSSGNLSGTASGTLIRSTSNAYTTPTTTAGTGSETISDSASAYWDPAAPKLRGLLARSVISGTGKGAATEYSYDSSSTGNITQERRWDSTKASTLPSSLTSSNASITQRGYDGYGNLLQVIDPKGNVTAYTLDSSSLFVVKEIEASGSSVPRTFSNTWDPNLGVKTSSTDVDNQATTTYSYDAQGRQTQMVLANGWQQNTTYDDANRRVITRKDTATAGAGDNVSVANFDQLGRLTLTQSLDQGSLNASDITTGTKQQTRYRYSDSNFYQLVSNLYAESTSQSYGNCQNSCVIGWTVTKFDQNGRPIAATTYDGGSLPPPWGSSTNVTGTSTAAYSGKTTTSTEQAGKVQQKTMDALGRLAGVVEDPGGLNYPISYSYDALDNLVSVGQSGQSRAFVYDSLARLSSATNPESGPVSYTYDANGNLLSKLDNLGVTTTYTYDALNRTASKSYSGSTAGVTPSVTYSYCNSASCGVSYGVGRLKSVSTSQGNSTNYTAYNSVGSVLGSSQTVGGKSYPFTYSYTPSSALTQEVYPTNRQINYGYLYADRPQSISGSKTSGGVTTNTTYVAWMGWASSTELSRSLGSLGALITDLRLNARGQLTQFNMLDWNHADNSPYYVHWQWFYNYGGSNNNGNLLSVTEYNSPSLDSAPSTSSSPAVTTNFSYDGVNRLASVSDNSYTRSMCYDAYGNGWVTGYTGNPAVAGNAPREIGGACPAGSGATPYATATNRLVGNSYDANGNQTIVGGNTVNYDAEGRVSSVVSGSTTLASYQYDGEGRRVQKTAQGVTTNFVYDASGVLVAEYAGSAVSKEYVRFHSGYISSNVDLVAIENAAGTGSPCSTCFVIPDQLGNVRLVADNAGHAAARHDYLPFGEETVADPNRPAAGGFGLADLVRQRFTGKERDAESGLDYFGARYYGGALGRFTSPDPSNLSVDFWMPQTWNRYAYVLNNPLSMTDRNGLWPFYIHNEIINEAFPGMSSQDLKQLKTSSWNMDYASGQQDPSKSYEHGMRDGLTNQDPMQAQQEGDDFITKNVQEAQQDQADWIASGHTGLSPKALTAFGNALHTATDRTSPAHAGNQPWYNDPWWNKRTRDHFWTESKASPAQMNNAVNAARYLFNQTFGNEFDWMMLMMKSGQACVTVSDSASHSFFGECQ